VNTDYDNWAPTLPTFDWTANAIMSLLREVEIDRQDSDKETSQSEHEDSERRLHRAKCSWALGTATSFPGQLDGAIGVCGFR
jgi:hypothetical protein